MKIQCFMNKGIYITHDDGTIFSIQFGQHNYCENYQMKKSSEDEPGYESSDCEVAVFKGDDSDWLTPLYFEDAKAGMHTSVKGYVPVELALETAIYNRKLTDIKE